jgi:hypothetical protein
VARGAVYRDDYPDPGHASRPVAIAVGKVAADATQFDFPPQRGALTFGNCSSPFLEDAFRTVS